MLNTCSLVCIYSTGFAIVRPKRADVTRKVVYILNEDCDMSVSCGVFCSIEVEFAASCCSLWPGEGQLSL